MAASTGNIEKTSSGKEIIERGLTGFVTNYKIDRGFGFIEVPNHGTYFFNIKEVQNACENENGKRYVKEKQEVKGDTARGRRGVEFVNVRAMDKYTANEMSMPAINKLSMRILPKKIEFDASVWEELTCPICENVMTEPLETPCRHVFCGKCIHKWATNQGSCAIPECGKPVNTKEMKPVTPNFASLLKKAKVVERGNNDKSNNR